MQINTGKHPVLCLPNSMATSVALRCYAWLKCTTMLPDIKAKIEGLPFDEEGFFHSTTNEMLTLVDDSKKHAKN